MNLRKAGIGKKCTALIGAPDSSGVATLGVRREVEDVAVTAGGQDDGIAHVDFDFAVVEVAGDNAAGLAVDDDEVQHVHARIHFHSAEADLALERLVGTEEELLASLAARVEGAGDLSAAEGTVVEKTAVLAGEGHALSNALVDDVHTNLGEAVDVAFTGAEVATFHCVVEQPVNAVAIIVIVLGSVDAALSGNGVGAAGTVLIAETLHVVAEFPEAGGSSATGEAGTDDDDVVLALVGRIDELEIEFVLVPGLLNRTGRDVGD